MEHHAPSSAIIFAKKKYVEDKNPSFMNTNCLSHLIVGQWKTITCNGHTFDATFFGCPDFDVLIHEACCYIRVDTEGGLPIPG
jgi:hypothetical protein